MISTILCYINFKIFIFLISPGQIIFVFSISPNIYPYGWYIEYSKYFEVSMYASTYDVDDAFISQDEMKELKKRELVRIERNIQG